MLRYIVDVILTIVSVLRFLSVEKVLFMMFIIILLVLRLGNDNSYQAARIAINSFT